MASINTSVGNFTPIESSENITIQTELVPTNAGQMESDINLRRTTKVGDFDEIGYISLIGEYPQNRIDIPRYDLSKVVSLGTDIANFNFILSLKVGDEEPKLFANKNVMIDLIAKYGKKEPIPVNYLINERKIVLIQLEPLNLLTEQMIATELSINLNSNKNVEVSRNLFTYTNYVSDEDGKLLANPSYDLNELIKYITWVVTKPNQNYDDRLLPSNVIGEWVSTINTETNTETGEDEPSTDTTNVPPPPSDTGSGNQGGSGNTGSYEPVGRAGTSQGEVVVLQTQPYLWDGTRWLRVTL